MRHTKRLFGLIGHMALPSVYAGVVLLVIGYLLGWTNHNAVLFCSLLLIIGGMAAYVWHAKRQNRY